MPSGKAGLTDYSKWDNIELSDDEGDCHPNIEKGTWFRLKHQKRVEREAKEKEERDELHATIEKNTQKMAEIEGDSEEKTQLQSEVDKCHAKLAKMDKNQKWNADNMCKTTEDRTIINREVCAHSTRLRGGGGEATSLPFPNHPPTFTTLSSHRQRPMPRATPSPSRPTRTRAS